MKNSLLILFCALGNIVLAQPGTEIYLMDLNLTSDKVHASNPENITNRPGYDNQPFFHPDKPWIYYVSADSTGETDIVIYDYKMERHIPFTHTPEREYSPTVTPDKQYISCIIQRENGAQDLGQYPIDGGEPEILISDKTVGYHAWGNNENLLVFVLPQPFALRWLNATSKRDSVIANTISRSLHKVPGEEAVSFIHKTSETEWFIKKINVRTGAVVPLTKSLDTREKDMAWTPDRQIIMSDGRKLFYNNASANSEWKEIAVQGLPDTAVISRIAISPEGNKIAVVVNE